MSLILSEIILSRLSQCFSSVLLLQLGVILSSYQGCGDMFMLGSKLRPPADAESYLGMWPGELDFTGYFKE
jgi:hypothetical protein